jgi:hypothetical protein
VNSPAQESKYKAIRGNRASNLALANGQRNEIWGWISFGGLWLATNGSLNV